MDWFAYQQEYRLDFRTTNALEFNQAKQELKDRKARRTPNPKSTMPGVKTLEEFDYNHSPMVTAAKMLELAEGGYIERAEPVLFIGECGTGKTHLLTGLCVAACKQKRRVTTPSVLRCRYFAE